MEELWCLVLALHCLLLATDSGFWLQECRWYHYNPLLQASPRVMTSTKALKSSCQGRPRGEVCCRFDILGGYLTLILRAQKNCTAAHTPNTTLQNRGRHSGLFVDVEGALVHVPDAFALS